MEPAQETPNTRKAKAGLGLQLLQSVFWAPRKISAFQCFCGHEKAANRAAWQEVLISTIDDIT
jgi:hypothetical protein